MNPLHSNLTPARHWKDIPQQVKHRAMSSGGRRRWIIGMAKTAAFIATVTTLGWGALQLAAVFRKDPRDVPAAVKASPMQELVLTTDGTLDQEWLGRTLAIPKGSPLVTLDLFKLRARLLTCGQVRSATLTRNFPSTLAVTISERPPVARLQVRDANHEPRTLFVAREGIVFEGIHLNPQMVETLPWVAGVKLIRQGGNFLPIADMEMVADLLAKAKFEAEHLYADWRTVSLERLRSDAEIEVTAKNGSRYIFGTRLDFFRQLANLDAILDAASAHPEQALREIDLTVGGQVPVLVGPATAVAAGEKGSL